jgi:hypothetical protein
MKKIIFLLLFIFLTATSGRTQVEMQPLSNWGTGSYNDIVVNGDFAYCAAGAAGLDIVNVGNPEKPLFAGNCRLQHKCDFLFITGKYIYITGHNFTGNHSSFTIVDISSQNHPEIMGTINDFGSYIREVVVVNGYAYIGTYQTLTILDISNPALPRKTASCDLGIAPMWLAIRGNYAYMANIFRGLQVIDISDPAAPILVTTNESLKRLNDITLQGNFAYVSSESDGLGVFDISNPEEPSFIGKYQIDGGSQTIGKSADGSQIILTDKDNTLYTFAISNPARPELSSTFAMAGTGNGIASRDNLIFITEGIKGMEIIALSKPKEPEIITHYDFSGNLKTIALSSKNAYLGDYDGIQILDLRDPTTPKQVGRVLTGGRVSGMFLEKNFLYSVGDQFFGLKINDISNPAEPETVASIDPEEGEDFDFTAVAVADNYAYITSYQLNQVLIYNVSDPKAPFLASRCDCPGTGYDLTINNNYAIIANGYNGFSIIDITKPLQPALISSGNRELYGYRVAATGNFVYLSGGNRIAVFDISDPTQPEKITSIDCDCENIYDLSVDKDYLHAGSDTGLKTFSITNRRQPRKIINTAENYEVYGVFSRDKRLGIVTGSSGKFMLLTLHNDALIDKIPPAPVNGISTSGQGFASIRLNWQTVADNDGGSGIGSYRIYRHDYSLKNTYATIESPLTEFVDPRCEPDSVYTYTIKAVDKSDNSSPASRSITVKTRALSNDDTPPTAPTCLQAKVMRGKLVLIWNLSFDRDSGVKAYELYKTRVSDAQPDGTGPTTKLTTPFTSFTDIKLVAGGQYRYWVRAVDYAGNPSQFTTIAITIPKEPAAENYSYFFPHFCGDEDGWNTLFSITNHNSVAADAYLQLLAADGTKLMEKKLYYRRHSSGFVAGSQIYSNDWIFRGKIPPETAWMKLDSNLEISLQTTLTSDFYQEGLKAVSGPAPELLFPVVLNTADQWTGLALANPATEPAQIILKAYDDSGKLLASSPPFSLPANGNISALANDFFSESSLPKTTTSIRAEATTAIVGMEFFSRPNSDMAGLPAISLTCSTEYNRDVHLYILPENPADTSDNYSVSLVNLSSQTAATTILRQDQADITRKTTSLTIPGNGKYKFTHVKYNGGAIKVISDKPMFLFQECKAADSGRGLSTTCEFRRGLAEINFTHLHLDRHDDDSNLITVTNLSRLQPNPIILEFFQGDGELLQTREKIIPAGSTFSQTFRDLLGIDYSRLDNRNCWLRIRGDLPINGFLNYQSADHNRMTMIPAE